MNNKILIFSAFIFSMVLFTSCDKEDEGFPAGSTERKTQDVIIEIQQVMAVTTLSSNMATSYQNNAGRIGSTANDCFGVTFDDEGENTKIIIDYGDGCNAQGISISGKYSIMFGEAQWIIGYDNLGFDGKIYDGSITMDISNLLGESTSTAIPFWHDLEITNKITGEITTFSSSLIQELTGNQLLKLDGEYSGSSSKGYSFESAIMNTLQLKLDCTHKGITYPVAGVKNIWYEDTNGELNFSIDYGDGKCNTTAKIVVEDGPTFNLDLTKR